MYGTVLDMNRLFFLKEVLLITETPQPAMQQWLRDGFVVPTIKADGPGSRNQFDFSNLCEIVLFKRLIDSGVFREAAAKQIRSMPPMTLLEGLSEKDAAAYVVVVCSKFGEGQATFWATGDMESNILNFINRLKAEGWDVITMFNLFPIVKFVQKKIASL